MKGCAAVWGAAAGGSGLVLDGAEDGGDSGVGDESGGGEGFECGLSYMNISSQKEFMEC